MTQLADQPPLADDPPPTGNSSGDAPPATRRGRGNGRSRSRLPHRTRPPATAPPPREDRAPEQAFTGDLVVLRRLARVRRGTVVAMFTAEERPLLRQPGELLLPDRNPFKHRISVMPISTEPVRLQVRVVDLRTLDGLRLDALELSVAVRLQSEPDRILELAVRHGPQLGLFLNEQVREGMENTARAGIKMSTRTELQQLGVAELLRQRWLPHSFLSLLDIVEFEVIAEHWAPPSVVRRRHAATPIPTSGPPRPADVSGADRSGADVPGADDLDAGDPSTGDPAPASDGPSAGAGSGERRPVPAERADLHTDVRLLAAWRRRLPSLPSGIASARVGDAACVVAVVDAEPPAFEGRQVWEDLAGQLEDRHLQLLLCRGRTYDEIVRSWFAALGLPVRLEVQLRVGVTRERIELRLPAELDVDGESPADWARSGRGWTGSQGPAVAALRRLLTGRKLSIVYDERS